MPSRKRGKGKERKAKKLAEVYNKWQRWAHGEDISGRKVIECNHGFALNIPDNCNNPGLHNHPVFSFMNILGPLWNDKPHDQISLLRNLKCTVATNPQVWEDETHRQTVTNILILCGVNMILAMNAEISQLVGIVDTILVLENYHVEGDFDSAANSRVAATKMRDIMDFSSITARRDVLKFFRKRLTACSCLKKMHVEARKTRPKLGNCFHCGVSKERRLLMVCGRCRISQYCSRECQMADWSVHKRYCDLHVKAHRQNMHALCRDCSCCKKNSFVPPGLL